MASVPTKVVLASPFLLSPYSLLIHRKMGFHIGSLYAFLLGIQVKQRLFYIKNYIVSNELNY